MAFDLKKLKYYRKPESFRPDDLVDIMLPSELAAEKAKAGKFLVFVVDDNPYLLQAINIQLSEISLYENSKPLQLVIKNYATGRSLLKDLHLQPDLVILDPEVNSGIKNMLSGSEIIAKLVQTRKYQPILLLGNFGGNQFNICTEPELKDRILEPSGAYKELNEILQSLLSEG
ncbi:MAG: hypothetical protein AAGF85_11940 [Bacteroidota bacterium]